MRSLSIELTTPIKKRISNKLLMSPLSTCVLGVKIGENFAILGPDGITVRKFPLEN